jgi:hypothetical protein
MKKNFSQLLILIPLLFIAGGAFAAYSYVGPTSAPTGNNTDIPLDVSSSTQIKNGGLSVNAFQVQNSAYFDQGSIFSGMIRGDSQAVPTSNTTIYLGTSSNPTAVAVAGSMFASGTYQSDALKTGGAQKPLCANTTGTFYFCDATPPPATPPPATPPSNPPSNGSGSGSGGGGGDGQGLQVQ